jgi:hypothetical protein
MFVHLSICTQQLGSHWMDFNDTWYLIILWKSVKKIQVSLKSDKNNKYFTILFTFMTISCWIILRMRSVSNKSVRENQNVHFIFHDFSESCAFYKIMLKNMLEPERPQTTIWWHVACWIGKATCAQAHSSSRPPLLIHTHAHTYRNVYYCFFTAMVASWICFNIMLYIHCLSCYLTLLLKWRGCLTFSVIT